MQRIHASDAPERSRSDSGVAAKHGIVEPPPVLRKSEKSILAHHGRTPRPVTRGLRGPPPKARGEGYYIMGCVPARRTHRQPRLPNNHVDGCAERIRTLLVLLCCAP